MLINHLNSNEENFALSIESKSTSNSFETSTSPILNCYISYEESEHTIITTKNYSVIKNSEPSLVNHCEKSLCWFAKPNLRWDLEWYFGVRGGESLHLYIWVMKDLCW